jgi:hypothetical protein
VTLGHGGANLHLSPAGEVEARSASGEGDRPPKKLILQRVARGVEGLRQLVVVRLLADPLGEMRAER